LIRILRTQSLLERLGALIAAALLIKFAIDFLVQPALLAVPFLFVVSGSIGVLAYNVFSAKTEDIGPGRTQRIPRGALLVLVPAGFFASSLGCTGLEPFGCSPFCTFVKLVWVPALGIGALLYYLHASRPILLALTAMCFVPLYPHCVCRNVANAWWIDRFGASVECYVWGFTAALIVLTSLRKRRGAWPSLAVSGLIVSGALAFFVGHHYFKFPW
jgi:hypothetical protein